jgi:hypothetical protein
LLIRLSFAKPGRVYLWSKFALESGYPDFFNQPDIAISKETIFGKRVVPFQLFQVWSYLGERSPGGGGSGTLREEAVVPEWRAEALLGWAKIPRSHMILAAKRIFSS